MLTIFSVVCLALLLIISININTEGNEQATAGKIVLISLLIGPFIDALVRLFTIQ